ncbi:MAG: indolepyruvate oxidoreductase subunit beta [Bacillota bacterium]|nr:indolepyruvate oxidoreductase subunit beta [Bacillota bacterium]
MSKTKNILIVGVGGQGSILASNILSMGLIEAGFDVKMAEIHGMSQRGGSVSSQVRYGEKVFSPIIIKGEADIIVAFELMEALRWLEYLKPDGKIIVNDYKIPPISITSKGIEYPKNIMKELESKVEVYLIDGYKYANKLGNAKVMNIIMLGALLKFLDLEEIDFNEIIESAVKEKFIDVNIEALNYGKSLI